MDRIPKARWPLVGRAREGQSPSRFRSPHATRGRRSRCPPPSVTSGGIAPRQSNAAIGRRGWKAQPAGGAAELGGSPDAAGSRPFASGRGTEPSETPSRQHRVRHIVDLRLHRDVQRRGRFIQHQQVGFKRQRARCRPAASGRPYVHAGSDTARPARAPAIKAGDARAAREVRPAAWSAPSAAA